MELLEKKIAESAVIRDGVVIVSGFLNHRMDVALIDKIGEEFYRIFGSKKPTLILTAEASGIGIACLAARYFGVDVLFAKKSASRNVTGDTYNATVRSFTRGSSFEYRIAKNYISSSDRVLIIDDFLAEGEALSGLISLVEQAGAEVVGAGVCVEKAFQSGEKKIRAKGIDLHALAVIETDEENHVFFRHDND